MAPPKATSPAIEIEVGDRDRADHQPGPGLLPRARRDQARPRQLLPVGRRRHRQRAARAAVHAAPLPRGRRPARRCTRSGCRTARRPGWRRCGCTSRATTGTPTSCASPSWPASSGRCRCRRSSSTRGTPGGPTPRSPTSGASTSTRCRTARFDRVRRVAHVAHEVLDELGAVGWPKTSGGKGLHIYVRIAPEHGLHATCAGPRWPSPARSSGARPTT